MSCHPHLNPLEEGSHPEDKGTRQGPSSQSWDRAPHAAAASESSGSSSVTVHDVRQAPHTGVPTGGAPLGDKSHPRGTGCGHPLPPTLEETAVWKHGQEKQAFPAQQSRGKKQAPKESVTFANLPAPRSCFLPHCSPPPHPDPQGGCQQASFRNPTLLGKSGVIRNPKGFTCSGKSGGRCSLMSLGGCPGLWQLWSWQLLIFTTRSERESSQSEMRPEEAGNSQQPSPDQALTE